ncbi:hypothetical protein DLJ47_28440 [Micromonospora sp. S4605]|nr:hypothetical protein DLJ47_28440 [Micromonospora sp. S4605]
MRTPATAHRAGRIRRTDRRTLRRGHRRPGRGHGRRRPGGHHRRGPVGGGRGQPGGGRHPGHADHDRRGEQVHHVRGKVGPERRPAGVVDRPVRRVGAVGHLLTARGIVNGRTVLGHRDASTSCGVRPCGSLRRTWRPTSPAPPR